MNYTQQVNIVLYGLMPIKEKTPQILTDFFLVFLSTFSICEICGKKLIRAKASKNKTINIKE